MILSSPATVKAGAINYTQGRRCLMVMVNIYTEDDKGHDDVWCTFELSDAQVVSLEEKAKHLNLTPEGYIFRLLALHCYGAYDA
jgi:hypothetical protein